jgi:hypothetical protein
MQIYLVSPSWAAPIPADASAALQSSGVAFQTVPELPGVSSLPCVAAVDSSGAVRFEWRSAEGVTAAALVQWAGTDPTPLPAPPAPPVALSPLQFIMYLQSETGLTNAQITALKTSTDPNIGALMLLLQLAGQEIVPGGQLVTQGLALLVADSYLTAAQSAAVVANWPTTPPAV